MLLAKDRVDAFWSWFMHHELELCALDSAVDHVFDMLIDELHKVHDEFFCEYSVDTEPHELIVTAEGKRELFPLVDELIAAAPAFPKWKVISLKPAQGFDFVTSYEGVDYDPKSMWFLPLNGKGSPPSLGLRVGIPNYSEQKKTEAKFSVLIILDTGLGERVAAKEVPYVEVVPLPSDPPKDGYIELVELAEYIEWRKRKQAPSSS